MDHQPSAIDRHVPLWKSACSMFVIVFNNWKPSVPDGDVEGNYLKDVLECYFDSGARSLVETKALMNQINVCVDAWKEIHDARVREGGRGIAPVAIRRDAHDRIFCEALLRWCETWQQVLASLPVTETADQQRRELLADFRDVFCSDRYYEFDRRKQITSYLESGGIRYGETKLYWIRRFGGFLKAEGYDLDQVVNEGSYSVRILGWFVDSVQGSDLTVMTAERIVEELVNWLRDSQASSPPKVPNLVAVA